jgi:L-cysteine:1D-myo-inositol 2-amino-2-deoxy-alpha-D-glucopyranoside ligase
MSAAQSRLISGQKFARSYVHTGMVGLNGEKMSKSLGNLVFVSTLIKDGVEPAAIRWALMNSHFAKDLMWEQTLIEKASDEVNRLRLLLARIEVAPTDVVIEKIIEALSRNLDSPRALDWMNATESGATGGVAGELSRALDTLLGLAL